MLQTPKGAEPSTISRGVWQGEMQAHGSYPPNENQESQFTIQILSCDYATLVRTRFKQDEWEQTPRIKVVSQQGSHLLYYVNQDNEQDADWVEIQTWQMIEFDQQQGIVQWDRMVNNRQNPLDHPNRAFSHSGIAKLRHISNTCPDR